MTGSPGRPSPCEDDLDTAGFWAATRRRDLSVLTCTVCGTDLHVPRRFCPSCGSWDTTWRPVSGAGTLYSWTVVERQVHPAFPTPYTVVLVELADAPAVRLAGSLPGRRELRAGMRMELRYEELDTGAVLPQWVPAPPDEV